MRFVAAAFGCLFFSPFVQLSSSSSSSFKISKPSKDQICDANCQYETVDQINSQLYPLLHDITDTVFFRYFKANLQRECPFWHEPAYCVQRDCIVNEADESEVPDEWKSSSLSSVDFGLGTGFGTFMQRECDEKDFCIMDDDSKDGVYVNLVANPERFTGYSGDSARRIWTSIYNENCFNIASSPLDETCLEKRVFYRILSGLHTSISIHICHEYLNRTTGTWGPNLDCYIHRVGKFPDRVQNVYFVYVVALRAMEKLAPFLEKYRFCTGNSTEDKIISNQITQITSLIKSAKGRTFDESALFQSKEDGLALKEEFKVKFRNISRIMDCVACQKCRLWGKIQIMGLGTVMKVLFSFDNGQSVNLKRAEIVALFNTFHRLAETIAAISEFDAQYQALHSASTNTTSTETTDMKDIQSAYRLIHSLFTNPTAVWNLFKQNPMGVMQFILGFGLVIGGSLGIIVTCVRGPSKKAMERYKQSNQYEFDESSEEEVKGRGNANGVGNGNTSRKKEGKKSTDETLRKRK